MIMSSMREKTKIVLFTVLIAFVGFIFFDWGMQVGTGRGAKPGVVGRVNGRDLTTDQYQRVRQEIIQTFETRTGREMTAADYDAVEDEVWLSLVRQALLDEQIEKYGIVVSDVDVLEILRTDPPEAVRARFTNAEGKFDVAAYQAALSDPAMAPQWAAVEAYLREMLPAEKLQNYVGLNARITDAEVREAFVARNEKVKCRYVGSAASTVTLPEGAVSEDDVRKWYDAHLADYALGERAVLEYVRVSKAATPEDSAATREDLEGLRAQIVGGTTPFEEVARAWSDDPASAERGGDLGTFGKGDMVPEFDRIAFSIPIGEVSPVFATPFGYHILKVEERKKDGGRETARAHHVLLAVEPSNETERAASDRIEDFLALVNEDKKDWAAAAAELSLEVRKTPPFESGQPIEGLGLLRSAGRYAFGNAPGTVTKEPFEDQDALYAFRVAERLPAGTAAFEDVKDRVRVAAEEAARRGLARSRLEEALRTAGGSLEALAGALSVPVDTTGEFTRASFVPAIGARNAFVATAFALEPGRLSGPVETDRGYYVLQVESRIPPDDSQFASQADPLRQRLLLDKRQELIATWLEGLLARAEIQDFRSGTGVAWTPDESLFLYGSPAS